MLAPLITMLAGLAVRDAVLEETGLAPDLRWPNDLLLAGKKFCGILTEMHAEPDRVHFVIVGIGINVNHASMPAELAGIATSLRMVTGKTHSRLQLLVRLLRHLETYYNRFLTEGPAADRGALRRSFQLRAGKTRAHHHGDGNLHRHHRRPGTQRPAARAPRRRPRSRS